MVVIKDREKTILYIGNIYISEKEKCGLVLRDIRL